MTITGQLRILRDQSLRPAELYSATDIHDFATGLHFHPEIQVVLVLQGQRKFFLRDSEILLHAGECLIIPPYLPHRGQSVPNAASTFRSLYLSRSIKLEGSLPENHSALVFRDQSLSEYIGGMRNTEASELRVLSELIETHDLTNARQVQSKTPALTCPNEEALKQARNKLVSTTDCPPSLDLLAKTLGISKFHFTRQFSKLYGMSPYAFNMRCRLNLSKPLLARGDAVSSVAYDLGFFDQSHFGSHFKKIMGLTPASYQRAQILRAPTSQRAPVLGAR